MATKDVVTLAAERGFIPIDSERLVLRLDVGASLHEALVVRDWNTYELSTETFPQLADGPGPWSLVTMRSPKRTNMLRTESDDSIV
jgi:hypothetical protein